MSQNLIDCRGIKLILSLLKENTFGEVALLVILISTIVFLKQMFKVFFCKSTISNYSTNI